MRPLRRFALARRRAVAPLPPPVGADADRIQALLAEVSDFRLRLSSDLSLTAGAVEAGAERIAADVLGADRAELAAFEQRALAALGAVETPAPRARRRPVGTRLLPAAPLLAAAAVVAAVLTGNIAVPGITARPSVVHAVPVAQSWAQFSRLAAGATTAPQVLAAADQLHASLASLIAEASHDPGAAEQALQVLAMERSLLLQDNLPGASVVLAQAASLEAKLAAVLPLAIPSPNHSAARHARRSSSAATDSGTATQPQPTATSTQAPQPQPTGSYSAPAAPDAGTATSQPSPPASTSPSPSPSPSFNPLSPPPPNG